MARAVIEYRMKRNVKKAGFLYKDFAERSLLSYPCFSKKVRWKMQNLPFRTGETWLTDEDLILLDALAVQRPEPRASSLLFCGQHLDYWVTYNEDELNHRLIVLRDHGILEPSNSDARCLKLTAQGGDMWSRERRPPWQRICRPVSLGKSKSQTDKNWVNVVAVYALSESILDDFLRLWPAGWTKQGRRIIDDPVMLYWRSFPRAYAGWSDFDSDMQRNPKHRELIEENRTWWGTMSELLRFLPPATQS